ncbi:MAG: hypothetical protein GY940_10280, partial [bacterium]|nr:hypothetical protein [bacterium]
MGPGEWVRLAALMRRLADGGARSLSCRQDAALPAGPVNRCQESTPSGIVFDLYQHREKDRGVWVIVHGVTVNGRKDPRLVHFAHSIACSGVTCVVPSLEGLVSCRWEPGDLDKLVDLIVTVSAGNH